MKKLLILLLLPLFSFSQTYKDVMSIKSEATFKKVAIENNYELDSVDDEGWVTYGFEIQRDSIDGNKSSKWLLYNTNDDRFVLGFSRKMFFDLVNESNKYNEIFDKVKEKCSFYDILQYKGDDYACYSCAESTYKGKIGFFLAEGWGYIRHFPDGKSVAED